MRRVASRAQCLAIHSAGSAYASARSVNLTLVRLERASRVNSRSCSSDKEIVGATRKFSLPNTNRSKALETGNSFKFPQESNTTLILVWSTALTQQEYGLTLTRIYGLDYGLKSPGCGWISVDVAGMNKGPKAPQTAHKLSRKKQGVYQQSETHCGSSGFSSTRPAYRPCACLHAEKSARACSSVAG